MRVKGFRGLFVGACQNPPAPGYFVYVPTAKGPHLREIAP